MKESKGLDFDIDVLLNQIGKMNVMAISGGHVVIDGASYNKNLNTTQEIELPVSSGYLVRITLAWDDTYTVERVLRRRPKGKSYKETKVLGRVSGVYCDQVGEIAYRASCYKNLEFGEKVSA